jgi:hypothetical protein
MGTGFSLMLAATGAIIRFAVEPGSRVAGAFVNWDIVGDILMVAGTVGVLASVLWMAVASRRTPTATTTPEG